MDEDQGRDIAPQPAENKRFKGTKKKTGGKSDRIDIDLEMVERLAETGATAEEIWAMLHRSGLRINLRTFKRRLAEPEYMAARERGTLIRNFALRSRMVKQSQMMNSAGVTMGMFLAKNWLGMVDRDTTVNVQNNLTVNQFSPQERFLARMDRGADRIARRVTALIASVEASVGAGEDVAGRADDGAPAIEAEGSVVDPQAGGAG